MKQFKHNKFDDTAKASIRYDEKHNRRIEQVSKLARKHVIVYPTSPQRDIMKQICRDHRSNTHNRNQKQRNTDIKRDN